MLRVNLSVILVVLALAGAHGFEAKQPAVDAVLTEWGIDHLEAQLIPLLMKQLDDLQIPEIDGETHTPIGKITYELKNLKISNMAFKVAPITLVPGTGLSIVVSGVTAHLHLDWHYKDHGFIPVSDSGSADVEISQTTSTDVLAIGMDPKGMVTIAMTQCVVSIGHLDIQLHGGASWLYEIFTNVFGSQIKDTVQKTMQSQIPSAVNAAAAKALSQLSPVIVVDQISEVDLALTQTPQFVNQDISFDVHGEFYDQKAPVECPAAHHTLPTTLGTNEMVEVIVDEFLLNSGAFVYYNADFLQAVVTPDMIPPQSPLQLNTTCFKEIIPKLYSICPDCAMQLIAFATSAPEVECSKANGIAVTAEGAANISVIQGGKNVPVFELAVTANVLGQVAVENTTATGKLSYLKSEFTLVWSEIGTFDVTVLQSMVDFLIGQVALPFLNVMLGKGIEIPSIEGVEIILPTVEVLDGYVGVACNISYVPPPSLFDVNEDSFVVLS